MISLQKVNYEENRRKLLIVNLSPCSFCGFCEHACPTLNILHKRNYGPRGRVQLMLASIEEGIMSKEALNGLYTCLQCNACVKFCPSGIRVGDLVREFKSLFYETNFK